METRIASATAKGPREMLEDAGSALLLNVPNMPGSPATLLVGADGVGGEQHGEVASATGLMAFIAFLLSWLVTVGENIPAGHIKEILLKAVRSAHRRILQAAHEDPQLRGMSTTLVGALCWRGTAHIVWSGDSRAYLFTQCRLRQLTADHKEIQKLIDAGVLAAEEAKEHPWAHVISQCLGQEEGFAPSYASCSLRPGDIVLVATDGLTDVVPDSSILELCQTCSQDKIALEQLPQQLVDLALRNGTRDNVTVLCAKYRPRAMSQSIPDVTLLEVYSSSLAEAMFVPVEED